MKKFLLILGVNVFILNNCSYNDLDNYNLKTQSSNNNLYIHTNEQEISYKPKYLHFAHGHIKNTRLQQHPWPFKPLSIAHNIASYQNYGSGAYFHHGIDIRADAGTSVYASAGGLVVNIENYVSGSPLYWEVAILDDDGFLWQYHHIDKKSIPSQVWNAYKNSTPIPAGTKIGTIYYWPISSYGEMFHHIHLNVIGENKKYITPILLLEPLNDTQYPQFIDVGIIKNQTKWNSNTVYGQYSIYAKIHDLMMHKYFVVPPYLIQYSINDAEWQTVWKFDELPSENNTTDYIYDFYLYSMSCGNYTCRSLTINLGFNKNGNQQFPVSPGEYNIKIKAQDFANNTTYFDYNWKVIEEPK